MPKTDRPTRAQGRLIAGLLQLGRTEPDGWLRDEREAVTRLHTWAHGAPPNLGARPQAVRNPVHEDGHPDLVEVDPRLVRLLAKAGQEWGPLGVALTAGRLTDPAAVVHGLTPPDVVPQAGPGARLFIPGPDRVYEVMSVGTSGPDREVAELSLRAVDEPATPSCDEPGHDHSTSACLGPVEVEYRREGQVLINGHDPDGCDANLAALRAEVARLAGLLDEAGTRYESMRERRNRARDHAVAAERERDLLGGEVEDERRRAEHAEAERDEARQAADEARRDRDEARAQVVAAQQQIATDGEQLDRTARHREALADEVRELRARALTAEDEVRALREQRDGTEATLALYRTRGAVPHPPVELSVNGPGTVTCEGGRLSVIYEPAVAAEAILADHEREHPDLDEPAEADGSPQLDRPTRVAGIDGDPRRPSRDHYDEVGVTLSWRELRNLVALHLDHADTSPARPHLLARAMREDGAPLRLAEVLDR